MSKSSEIAEELFGLAQQQQNAAMRIAAHDGMADTLAWLGDFTAAQDHAEQALALYTPEQFHSLTGLSGGRDPGVTGFFYTALCQWVLGCPERALEASHQGLALANGLRHPFSQFIGLWGAGMVTQFCGHTHQSLAYFETLLSLADEQGFLFITEWAEVFNSWAQAQQRPPEEAVVSLRQVVAAYDATGAELLRSWFHTVLAEQYGKAGLIEEGLHAVREARHSVQTTGECWYAAEVTRIEGELTLQKDNGSQGQHDAETCFRKALDIARQQQAKSWELRTTMSLARLWQSQGKTAEARNLLASVYDWFTEGFDTADLQDAKGLLAELS